MFEIIIFKVVFTAVTITAAWALIRIIKQRKRTDRLENLRILNHVRNELERRRDE